MGAEIQLAALRAAWKSKHSVDSGGRKPTNPPVGPEDAIAEYLWHMEKENKPSTVERKEGILARWARANADRTVCEFSKDEMETWKRERSDHVALATVNRELATFSHFLNWGIAMGYRTDNPVQGIRRYPENKNSWRHLSWEEGERLLAACKAADSRASHLHLLVLTALYTGLRRGDLLSLEWEQIDLPKREIRLVQAKTTTRTCIPMHRRLHGALWEARCEAGYVFPSPRGTGHINDPRAAFATAARRAGLGKVRFHDLRHTFASWLVEEGADLFTVQELLGHRSLRMTRRYAHLSAKRKRQAIDLLGGAQSRLPMHQVPAAFSSRRGPASQLSLRFVPVLQPPTRRTFLISTSRRTEGNR